MKDYYATLGVGRNATRKEIRDAYLELARQCHPDHMPKEGKWILVNERFAEITEAYEVLANDKRRVTYDRQLKQGLRGPQTHKTAARVQAERAFKNGLESLKRKNYASAQAFFKAAARLDGNVAKYKSYQGLAQAHTGYRMKEALELCISAIDLEVYNSDLYVNLAIVYKLAGQLENCRKKLKEALKWNPKDQRAAELFSEVTRKGNFFRRMFGRGGKGGRA
ncbi:MAG: DnaJ domain-containing protein [bacterium]